MGINPKYRNEPSGKQLSLPGGFRLGRQRTVRLVPSKPKRPCSAPGCPELTRDRFCPLHAKKADKNYRKFQRDPRINKRYGARWRRIRAAYIAQHPLCEDCLDKGLTTPVAEVHHVLPLDHGGSHDFSNLRSLCKPCHSKQSALDGDRWRQTPRVYSY